MFSFFKLTPPRIVLLSFLGAIFLGTILLSLPVSRQPGQNLSFIDALFTAASAACVTGLVVKDTGLFFSNFGQMVILVLFQAGGLGIMTLSTVFAVMLGKKLSLKENLVIQSTVGQEQKKSIITLLKYILLLTFMFEALGTIVLLLQGFDLKSALFHAVSAFCNAGFSLYSDSFISYQGDVIINLVMIVLIITGGLGFVVLLELPQLRFYFSKRKNRSLRLSLQTKIVFGVSLVLLVLGTLGIFVLEDNTALAGLSFKNKICASFFQSASSRTAGFNTLEINSLSAGGKWCLIFLMFVGASPGSTGGGIKTVTLGVVLVSLGAMLRNRPHVSVFGRRLPREVLNKAIAIFCLALLWVFVFTLLLCVTESNYDHGSNVFIKILFEVTSAFGTVGLSTGITPYLSLMGKVLIIITMFVGRIGPLTLALAVALREQAPSLRYPEEKVMVG